MEALRFKVCHPRGLPSLVWLPLLQEITCWQEEVAVEENKKNLVRFIPKGGS